MRFTRQTVLAAIAASCALSSTTTTTTASAFVPSAFEAQTNRRHAAPQNRNNNPKSSLFHQTIIKDEERRKNGKRRSHNNNIISSTSSSSSSSSRLSVSLSDLPDLMTSSDSPYNDEQRASEMAKLAAIEARASAAAYMAQYENQSGASIIYSKLLEYGVTTVNGFSGGAVLPLLDQFHEEHPRHAAPHAKPPIRWITNSNEASAGHIAEGMAKALPINGKHKPIGVAIATSGPGLTNLITPLQDAICDGVPMLVLCGQAATTAPPDAFQQAPAVDLTRPCTKWSYQIQSAAELPLVMDYAFYVATHGRPGPVFVDLPKDLQNQVLTSDMVDHFIDADNPGRDDSFARLVPRRRNDNGDIFQALRLGGGGPDGRGLCFDIYKDEAAAANNNKDGPIGMGGSPAYKLKPVVSSQDLEGSAAPAAADLHHLDHHTSNKIYFEGSSSSSSDNNSDKVVGDLAAAGSPLTDKILDLLLQAKKPIIIAGQGCNDSQEELTKFAETLQIPVTTTLHAMGCFDERNALACNMMGMHGHPTPNFLVQESDFVLNIGSRFDDRITGRMSDFIPEARKAAEEQRGGVLHVDVRLSERNKQLEPTFFVHSTAKNFLTTMNDALEEMEQPITTKTGPWLERKKKLQTDLPVRIPRFATQTVKVTQPGSDTPAEVQRTPSSAQSVVHELNRQLLEAGRIDDAVFTTGVGIHQMVAAQLITWTQPRQMLSSGSLGTMGVSLGYCIGAKLAHGDAKICISIDGDGSFNMTFTELKTVGELKIPVKLLILDNDGQMMVEYWQRLFHDNRLIAVRNDRNPDYVMLAKSFGIKSIYCDCEEDLPEKMKEFLFADPDEPVLFHMRIQRTPCLPMVAPGQPLDDMILDDVEVDTDGFVAPS